MPAAQKRSKTILLSVCAVLLVLVLGFLGFSFFLSSSDAEDEFTASETLPGSGADSESTSGSTDSDAATAPPGGIWVVANSQPAEVGDAGVGYRILEDIPVGGPEEITGRTTNVSGSLDVEEGSVTTMTVKVDMNTLASGVALRDQIVAEQYLQAPQHPEATFTITDPIKLPEAPEGEPTDFEVAGDLTIRGVTVPVTATGTGQWNKDVIEVVGSVDTTLGAFGVKRPDLMGRTARDEVVVEFKIQFTPESGDTAANVEGTANVDGTATAD
jgi:polyisoprenoid-binding protein YceI